VLDWCFGVVVTVVKHKMCELYSVVFTALYRDCRFLRNVYMYLPNTTASQSRPCRCEFFRRV